jgi:hypothetical protein
MLFNCPPPANLSAITPTNCPIKFGQIQKLAFGRLNPTEPRFDATTSQITAQAIWTALVAASDDSKLVISPYVSGFSIPPTEPVKQGGNDNTTINGLSELMGGQMVLVPFMLKNVSAETAKTLRAIATETMLQPGETNIGAYFLAEGNNVIYDAGGETDKFLPFPIYNLFIPDVASEGYNTNNTYNCSFEMPFGWSEYFKVVKADFNPRAL